LVSAVRLIGALVEVADAGLVEVDGGEGVEAVRGCLQHRQRGRSSVDAADEQQCPRRYGGDEVGGVGGDGGGGGDQVGCG